MHALLLALPLLAVGCAAVPFSTPAPEVPLAQPGAVLIYAVVAGTDVYDFRATITQNDERGTAFDFALVEGAIEGSVTMTPSAREEAPRGMLNRFEPRAYTLDDQTSVWLARHDLRRLKTGEAVAIDVDETGPVGFVLDSCLTRTIPFDGEDHALETCRIVGDGGRYLVVVDDDRDPLILEMNAGPFRVLYRDGTR